MGRKAKLNEDQIHEIRSSKESNKELGKRFGVSTTTIVAVRNFNGAYAGKTKNEDAAIGSGGSDSGFVAYPNLALDD